MCGRGESTAGDLTEESCIGPDTDSGHAGQDRVKRVSKSPLFCQCLIMSAARLFPGRGASLQSWVASFFSPSEASFSGEEYHWRRASTAG